MFMVEKFMVEKFTVEKIMVEKFMIEKFMVELSAVENVLSLLRLKNAGLKIPVLKLAAGLSLKSPGLKIEMSCKCLQLRQNMA